MTIHHSISLETLARAAALATLVGSILVSYARLIFGPRRSP